MDNTLHREGTSMKLAIATKFGLISLIALWIFGLIGCLSTDNVNRTETNSSNKSAEAASTAKSNSTPIKGRSVEKDISGDVRDGDYRKPRQEIPGIDLVNVELVSVESDLQVTFRSSSFMPKSAPNDEGGVWHVTACTPDGNQCCFFGAKVLAAEWKAYIFDMETARYTFVGAPIVRGNDLIVTLPNDKLPKWMGRPFKWWADSEWEGTWSDRVPNEGKDLLNGPTVPFPKGQE